MATQLPEIKVYWLDKSRAQRILWLLEELDLPYTVDISHRQNLVAPASLQKVHPLGKSPILCITPSTTPTTTTTTTTTGPSREPIVLAESGFIVQYLLDHFAASRNPSLVPPRWRDGMEGAVGGETDAYMRFAYLLHYAEGSFMPLVVLTLILDVFRSDRVPFFIRPMTGFVAAKVRDAFLFPNVKRHLEFLEDMLRTAPDVGKEEEGYLCGPQMTAADILMSFALLAAKGRFAEVGTWDKGSIEAQFPLLWRYLDKLEKSDGYVRAVKKIEQLDGKFDTSL